jgi:hypothetical protein
MRLKHGMIALMLSGAALGSAMTGCAGSSVIYDPYWRDYHPWDIGESRFYRQWEIGTHRNHMDFYRRNRGDQRAYWVWRHH